MSSHDRVLWRSLSLHIACWPLITSHRWLSACYYHPRESLGLRGSSTCILETGDRRMGLANANRPHSQIGWTAEDKRRSGWSDTWSQGRKNTTLYEEYTTNMVATRSSEEKKSRVLSTWVCLLSLKSNLIQAYSWNNGSYCTICN